MTSYAKTPVGVARSGRLLAQSVSSIDINQHMSISRRRCAAGSIAGDWRAVAIDLKRSVEKLTNELEPA